MAMAFKMVTFSAITNFIFIKNIIFPNGCGIEATSASFGYGRQRLCEPNSMLIQSLSLISKREADVIQSLQLSVQQRATTGMWVADECKKSYMEMKWKKEHRYIVFKIDEQSKLVTVDKVGAAGEGYGDLEASLPDDDCRYAVFDFDFVTVDNCRKSKIFFIAWAPSASRIRAKMLYATSKQGLRRVLEGIHYELQATDPTEMGFDVILDRAK